MTELPTYEEYTKNWTLKDKVKFYYEVDIDNFAGDLNELVKDITIDISSIREFEKEFRGYLIESEYIRDE